jgi:hypothetical protein
LLENIFCVRNDGKASDCAISGGNGSVGRPGRRGGGDPAGGVAFEAMGRTMDAANGLKTWSDSWLGDDTLRRGRIDSLEVEVERSEDAAADRALEAARVGLGEAGLTMAVVVVGTGVDDERGGELCGDDASRFTKAASSAFADDDVRCRRRRSSSSTSSSSSSSEKSSSTTCCRKKCECEEERRLSMLKADIFLRFASAELAT